MRFDAQGAEVITSAVEESDSAVLCFIGHDASKGDAGSIVNADVDILPPCAFDQIAAVAGNAVTESLDAGELFDVEVNELAWASAFIAARGRRRIEQRQAADGYGFVEGPLGNPAIVSFDYDLPYHAAIILLPEYPFEPENRIRAAYYRPARRR